MRRPWMEESNSGEVVAGRIDGTAEKLQRTVPISCCALFIVWLYVGGTARKLSRAPAPRVVEQEQLTIFFFYIIGLILI